uniref:Uncharacterized protein n=1 Tax=Anguilla anguilla TaxID=7936 RepID=A0A0E9WA77_ANGAN
MRRHGLGLFLEEIHTVRHWGCGIIRPQGGATLPGGSSRPRGYSSARYGLEAKALDSFRSRLYPF